MQHIKFSISIIVLIWITGCRSSNTQAPSAEPNGQPPETANLDIYGKPNLNGVWQAMGSAHWDLEAHPARMGPIVKMGAIGAIPAGLGVVVGGEIPYQDWARKQQQTNRDNWLAQDPVVKCYMPGIPRATYMPFPLQIIQGDETILFAYEFASASRVVYMNKPGFEHPFEAWMGHSRGKWEENTLVIDVASHVPDTWFDSAGNFHSEALRVEERYTLLSDNVMEYQATITDAQVFTRPWQIKMPLYRRLESDARLLEFKCVEFAEELMYGHLVKQPTDDQEVD